MHLTRPFGFFPCYTLGVCRYPEYPGFKSSQSLPLQCDLGTLLSWSSLSATVFLNWNCKQFWGEIIGLSGPSGSLRPLSADLLGQIRRSESTLLRGSVSGVGSLLGELSTPLAVLQTSLEKIRKAGNSDFQICIVNNRYTE